MDRQAWLGLVVDVAEEVAEVHGPVAGGQLAGHLPAGGVQRGVSRVIESACPHAANQGSSGALSASHRQAAERLAAGELWQEHGLVFCREDGTPLDRWHARKEFQKITKAARLGGEWTPRELPHSFVSILSAHDVRLEGISYVVGHSRTSVTETVYRHEIRPALI